MSEKKIFSIDVSMDEPMFLAIKGIAAADGVTAPEYIRMVLSSVIEERRAYFAALEDIFGEGACASNQKRTSAPVESADTQLSARRK